MIDKSIILLGWICGKTWRGIACIYSMFKSMDALERIIAGSGLTVLTVWAIFFLHLMLSFIL